MANNRFTNLRRAKPVKDALVTAVENNHKPQPDLQLGLTEPELPKRGRPRAKRSSDDFSQATAYIKKETYTAVRHLLLDQKKEYSILVQELLDEWLLKQK